MCKFRGMKNMLKYASAVAYALLVVPGESQILVRHPESVRSAFPNGLIQGSTAAFGTPLYGDMFLGQLVYGAPNDVDSPHCDSNYTLPETRLPKIVVVRRGGCQFVDKVLIAQQKGAASVIVVDDDPSRTVDKIRLIIMADDRWGKRDIVIPSVLVTKRDGDTLVQQIEKNAEVIVRMEWDIPNEHTVNVDLWSSPAIRDTTNFLKSFSPIAREFKYDLDFVPHYWIFDLSPSSNDMEMCTDASARYCAFDPDLNGKLKGADIVWESLRQLCLWKTTSNRNTSDPYSGKYSDSFWRYVELVDTRCPILRDSPVARLTEDCSYSLMQDLGVDVNKVKMCVQDDHQKQQDGDSMLDAQKKSLAWSPSALMINNHRYSGPLEANLVTNAICTGFVNSPELCNDSPSDSVGDRPEETVRGFPWWGYVVVVAALFVPGVIAFVVYRLFFHRVRRQLRYEVFEEVNSQLQKGGSKAGDAGTKTGSHTPDTSREDLDTPSEPNCFVDVRIV